MSTRRFAERAPWLLCVLLLAPAAAPALSTDKDQPIEVEADSAELDDARNVSVYRGNVVVVQGSIHMTGDLMTVHQTDDDELETLIMEGKPATYRQLPDGSTVPDEAEARRMEYHELKNLVILIDEARVKQGDVRLNAERVEYDTALSKVKAWNNPDKAPDAAAPEPGSGRIKIIIKKKEKTDDKPADG
jgi:lipopolysaccharide export system protein LptA